MNYAQIKPRDIANGPGVRVALFVSGCTHRCKGCFNSEAWDFSFGEPFDSKVQERVFNEAAPGYIAGLSLLGGEPMEPRNQAALLPFIREFKRRYPQKTIWCFSGYTFEELTGNSPAHTENTAPLLSLLDVLVDGEFHEQEKNLKLLFRGSANQRLLNMKESLAKGEPILWEHKSYGGAWL